jgi:hypothetical protein
MVIIAVRRDSERVMGKSEAIDPSLESVPTNAHHEADYQSGVRGHDVSVAKPTYRY